MIIASFNVNSVRARLQNILDWIKEFSPDVVLMQEIKCEDRVFPRIEFEDAGYNVKTSGQKAYNGVAILSKYTIEDITYHLPNFQDDPAERFIECFINGNIRIINIYAPNGNPVGSEKFTYKQKWMELLKEHIKELLKNDEMLIIGGDFNVALTDRETYDVEKTKDDAVMQLESRQGLKDLISLGLTDAYRIFNNDKDDAYSWWSYMSGDFQKNKGMLLDYFLINDKVKEIITNAGIDISARGKQKPSDHTPIWIELKDK